MARMQWDEKYSVKIKKIDDQHKRLFEMINSLHDAMIEKRVKEHLEDLFRDLISYADTHFRVEENYMVKFNYPGFTAHHAEHQAFIKKVKEFQKSLNEGKIIFSMEVMNFLRDWLTSHILVTDVKYSSLFHEKGLE